MHNNTVAKLRSFAVKMDAADSLAQIRCKNQMQKSILLRYNLQINLRE